MYHTKNISNTASRFQCILYLVLCINVYILYDDRFLIKSIKISIFLPHTVAVITYKIYENQNESPSTVKTLKSQ
jgi:hypothetical protein